MLFAFSLYDRKGRLKIPDERTIDDKFVRFVKSRPGSEVHYQEGVLGITFQNSYAAIAVLAPRNKERRDTIMIYRNPRGIHRGRVPVDDAHIHTRIEEMLLPQNAETMRRFIDRSIRISN